MSEGPEVARRRPVGDDDAMTGPIILVIVLVVAMPVGVIVSGAVGAALLGWLVKSDVDASHEGSELLATNN